MEKESPSGSKAELWRREENKKLVRRSEIKITELLTKEEENRRQYRAAASEACSEL
jgi:hypothetical protein